MFNILNEAEYKVSYTFDTEEQDYLCTIRLKLPCNDRGKLHETLQNKHMELLLEPLIETWGWKPNNGDKRERTVTLRNQDLELLKREERDYLIDLAAAVEQVARDNELTSIKLPDDRSGKLTEYM